MHSLQSDSQKKKEKNLGLGLDGGHVLLDGVREFGEHRLAANLELVVPYANEHLRLERVGEDVRVALNL